MKTCILNLLLEYIFSFIFTREFIVVCARVGGANTTPFLLAARQLHWHEKLRRRKSEGGAGIPFPPTPFPSRPARAEKFSALPREARQSKFAVRIFIKKSSDFNQKAPPIFRIRILGDYCLAPPKAGLGFGKDFERIFEIQKQFLPAQTEVRRAKLG